MTDRTETRMTYNQKIHALLVDEEMARREWMANIPAIIFGDTKIVRGILGIAA